MALRLVIVLGLVSLLYVNNFLQDEHMQQKQQQETLGRTFTKELSSSRSSSTKAKKREPSSSFPYTTVSERLPSGKNLMFVINRTVAEEEESTPWYRPDLCRRDEIIDGRWVPEHLDRPPYIPTVVHLRCYPRESFYSKGGWDTYRWVPKNSENEKDQCDFGKWRRETYCAVLKYATVMIVGDSLSWEHYASLVQLLGVHTHQGYQHMSRELRTNIGQAVCGGRSRVVYRRDDRLSQLHHALLENETSVPQVLVLNRGAHYDNDTVLLENVRENLAVVEKWQDRCDELGIKCHFFWRTTVPGHPGCWNDTTPENDKAAIEARIGNLSLYDEVKITYHWYDFQHQNELVEKELKSRGIRYRILDAYHLNVLRPDEHRAHQGDCLHSCYPGKMDVYSRLMLHYLRGDRTARDVEILGDVKKEKGWNINITTLYDKNATAEASARRVAAGGRLPDPKPQIGAGD
jgi:hypothetical protein